MAGQIPLAVLVIEDDADARDNLTDILEFDGYRVESFGRFNPALARRDWSEVLAIILDRRLPDGTADELLPRLRAVAPHVPVVIVTGFADLDGAIAALRQGAADYILKPINADALRSRLERIAETRNVREALHQSETALNAVLRAAPCVIVILSARAEIRYFSPFAEGTTGYDSSELADRNFFDLFVPDGAFRQGFERTIRQALAGSPTLAFENPIRCRDGAQRWMMWNAQRLDDYRGEEVVLAVGQDITSLKQAQQRALQSERLAAIGQMMTGLAHESRNALQRSQACLEMLTLEVRESPRALDLVSRIQRAQDDLHQLYEEVRGYAAPIQLKRRDCDLREILRETWDHLEVARAGRDARLIISDGPHECRCEVDRFALEQVFRNVLENSLSAGEDPVEIAVRFRLTHLDGRPALEVSLTDNGPGLSPEARKRIFEPFFTTKTKGTGLGMPIVQRLVEAHGGTIAVGGADQRGTTIIVTIPCSSTFGAMP